MSIRSVARAAWLPKRSRFVYVELLCFLASTLGTVSKRDSELFLSFSERFIEHVNVDKDVCFAKAEAFGHDLRILLVRSYRRNLRHVYAKPHDSSNWTNTDTEIQITSKPLPYTYQKPQSRSAHAKMTPNIRTIPKSKRSTSVILWHSLKIGEQHIS